MVHQAAPAVTFILCAIDKALERSWKEAFPIDLYPKVKTLFVRSILLDVQDRSFAIVSPANVFGIMDGGIDLEYSKLFGWPTHYLEGTNPVQKYVQQHFKDEQLPIGEAVVVETGHATIPELIVAPTMRYPNPLPKNSQNPFLAARAVFQLVKDGKVKSSVVACPGLGTGIGAVTPSNCAQQMRRAYDSVFHS